jgi:hypothetical protein
MNQNWFYMKENFLGDIWVWGLREKKKRKKIFQGILFSGTRFYWEIWFCD